MKKEEKIKTALEDFAWLIIENTTAIEYATFIANKLNFSVKDVLQVIKKQARRKLSENENLYNIIGGDSL